MGFTHFANVEDMCARLILHLIYANWDSLMDNKILEQGGWTAGSWVKVQAASVSMLLWTCEMAGKSQSKR